MTTNALSLAASALELAERALRSHEALKASPLVRGDEPFAAEDFEEGHEEWHPWSPEARETIALLCNAAPALARAVQDYAALMDEAIDVVDDVVIAFSDQECKVKAKRIDRWKDVAARLRAAAQEQG